MAHPAEFYKYLSPSTADAVLATGRFRWSSPLLFDDPSEFRRMPRFHPSVVESYQLAVDALCDLAKRRDYELATRLSPPAARLFQLFVQALKGGVPETELRSVAYPVPMEADAHINATLDSWVTSLRVETARVFCVSIDADNDDLWHRYASDHSGVKLTLRHIEERSTPLLAAREVAYAELPPVVGSGVDFLLHGDTNDLRRRSFDAIFMTKTAEWARQREWRALTWRPNEAGSFGDYAFFTEELAAVTCGRNATAEFRQSIGALVRARYPDCKFEAAPPSA